jgi:hypothetical protein
MPPHKSKRRRAETGDERLNRAERAGYRALDVRFTKLRSSLMRQLAELPRDGTADDRRAEIIRLLDLINSYLGEVWRRSVTPTRMTLSAKS